MEFKKQKQQQKHKLIGTENKLVVVREMGGHGRQAIYKLLLIRRISHGKVLRSMVTIVNNTELHI